MTNNGNKKKISETQRFALKCYIEAIGNEFHTDLLIQIREDFKAANYEDEYKALKGYMQAKTSERVSQQIERFFKKLLEYVL
jgi:hypothetical protein